MKVLSGYVNFPSAYDNRRRAERIYLDFKARLEISQYDAEFARANGFPKVLSTQELLEFVGVPRKGI